MKALLIICGHLRNNSKENINSYFNYIKENYTENIDFYLITYDSLGIVNQDKNYSILETNWIENSSSSETLKILKNEFNPKAIKIINYELRNFENITYLNKLLLKNTSRNKIINPGLLTSLYSQSKLRSEIIKEVKCNETNYNLAILGRPDVNVNGLKKINELENVNFVQISRYFNKDRAVNLSRNKKSKNKIRVDLIGEILFITKYKNLLQLNDEYFNKIEEYILKAYKENKEHFSFTEGDKNYWKNPNLPSWEMPEFIITKFAYKNEMKFKKVAVFNLKKDNTYREFRLEYNLK